MSRKTKRNLEPKQHTHGSPRGGGDPLRYVLLGGGVLALGVLVFFSVTMFMSDDGDDDFELPAGTDEPMATADPEGFGEAPELDGNIVGLWPNHGESVTQGSTRTPNPREPGGVCADIVFEETTGVWYRMAINGREVTTETTWDLTEAEDPQRPDIGRLCYAPEEGVEVGRVQAAVSVKDPENADGPPAEVIGWEFEVTE